MKSEIIEAIKALAKEKDISEEMLFNAIEAALSTPVTPGKPKAIWAHTVKGKGVSFMENQARWHGKAPNAEQRDQALKELEG